jgi:hypothetical protein
MSSSFRIVSRLFSAKGRKKVDEAGINWTASSRPDLPILYNPGFPRQCVDDLAAIPAILIPRYIASDPKPEAVARSWIGNQLAATLVKAFRMNG